MEGVDLEEDWCDGGANVIASLFWARGQIGSLTTFCAERLECRKSLQGRKDKTINRKIICQTLILLVEDFHLYCSAENEYIHLCAALATFTPCPLKASVGMV